jgi:acyl-CoA reductase-like NAD-dependent aldehyde dehydrogenase
VTVPIGEIAEGVRHVLMAGGGFAELCPQACGDSEAAKNLAPVLLELGGQNPAFVDATANVPDAARKIVWGALAWGGQSLPDESYL